MEPQLSPPNPSDAFRAMLKQSVTTVTWQTWLQPLRAHRDADTLTIAAPSEFHRRWVADRHIEAIRTAADATFGSGIAIEIEVDASFVTTTVDDPVSQLTVPNGSGLNGSSHGSSHGSGARIAESPLPQSVRTPIQDMESRLISKYTFENFVVGQSNRFANAAAMAVGEQPGSHYNPLFIYGAAGLGKTHLLHAVGHHRRELSRGSIVRHVSSEQFFNEFINGIRRKQMAEFKARYRTIDVLLLDDVQFFEGKEQILEEFFHTFNSLYEAGKQLVISSDRHPKNLATLEDRLRSRFEWGLLTDIQPPDVETRLAILRKNAEFAPRRVPKDVLEFIAANVQSNIRELEGALTRVTAYAALTHEEITLQMAQEVLQDLMPTHASQQLTPDYIMGRVGAYYGLTQDQLTGPSRKQPLARSRQIAMYLCRDLTDLSLPKIGKSFGGRDHTTVLHAVDKVKGLMQSDKQVFDEVSGLCQELRTTTVTA